MVVGGSMERVGTRNVLSITLEDTMDKVNAQVDVGEET